MTEEKKTKKYYGIWKEKTARGESWRFSIEWFDSMGNRHRKKRSGFPTKAAAQAVVDKLKADARNERMGIEVARPIKHTTIGEAVDAYYAYSENKTKARKKSQYIHAREYKGQLNKINAWAEFIGRRTFVREVNEDALLRWVSHELDRGLQLTSAARSLATIRACLNHAQRNNADLANYRVPSKPIKKSVDNKRTRILSEDEIVRLSAVLASDVYYRDAYDTFCLGLGTGGRLSEILGIRWQDVNAYSLRLFSSKTGKERWLHDVPAVAKIIEQRRADELGNATHVFVCHDETLRNIYEAVSKRDDVNIPFGQKVIGGWTFHDTRHTALTNLLANNVDVATVSKVWADHASIAETTRYLHPTARSKKLASAASNKIIELANGGRNGGSGNADNAEDADNA